jgi:hypothetical protein
MQRARLVRDRHASAGQFEQLDQARDETNLRATEAEESDA